MEVIAERGHSIENRFSLKRFSSIEYPDHESDAENSIRVTCKGTGGHAGYQHFCCVDCDKILTMEPLEVINVHVNGTKTQRYSVLKIGVQCPNCKKVNLIKIPFAVQFIVDSENVLSIDQDNKHPLRQPKVSNLKLGSTRTRVS